MVRTLVTFEQDGHSIDYVPPYLTRDIYLLSVDILCREWTDTQRIAAVADWCAEFCDGDTAQTLLTNHAAVLFALAFDMMTKAGHTPEARVGISNLLNIGTGGDEYEPSMDEAVCTCVRCRGISEDDSTCKFQSVKQADSQVVEWTHLAKHPNLLDAPYSLFQLSRMKARADSSGQAARRQEREKEREATKKAKSIREKHGHKW